MANYNTLKSAIADVVKTNNDHEITGALLQQVLFSMIGSLGLGYQYMGVATPSTNPGTPDQNVFYFAKTPGAYQYFSNVIIQEKEIALLKYNGAWSKEVFSEKSVGTINDLIGDFSIVDEAGNAIVVFRNGHIKTKYFDSEELPDQIVDVVNIIEGDFSILDQVGNALVVFKNGHIYTKNFNSETFEPTSKLANKKVLFFGDSITYYKEYVNAIVQKTKCLAYNRGLGSSCFEDGGTGVPASFCQRIDLPDDNRFDGAGMTIGLPTSVDYVIVEGGINDFGYCNNGNLPANFGSINAAINRNSFVGGLKYVLNKLKLKYGTVPIFVLGLIPTYSPISFRPWSQVLPATDSDPTTALTYQQTTEGKTWFDYNDAIQKVAYQFGAHFISLQDMGINPLITGDRNAYYKDGLHPNVAGGEIMATTIVNNISKYL